jgi:hypothetical protein
MDSVVRVVEVEEDLGGEIIGVAQVRSGCGNSGYMTGAGTGSEGWEGALMMKVGLTMIGIKRRIIIGIWREEVGGKESGRMVWWLMMGLGVQSCWRGSVMGEGCWVQDDGVEEFGGWILGVQVLDWGTMNDEDDEKEDEQRPGDLPSLSPLLPKLLSHSLSLSLSLSLTYFDFASPKPSQARPGQDRHRKTGTACC